MNDNNPFLAAILDFPPDDEAELVRHIPILLRGQSVQEVVLLRRCFLENQSDVMVAKESGVSAEIVARNREAMKTAHYTLRYLLQPPHADD